MIVSALAAAAALASAEPSYILTNGKIFQQDGSFAQAVAVEGRRIRAVGSDAEVLALKGPGTEVWSLNGRVVVPGFNDAHVHFLKGGLSLAQADLAGSTSIGEIVKRLETYKKGRARGRWVLGHGWDHTALPGGQYPDKGTLDALFPETPVFLRHVDGHIAWVNSAALRKARITAAAPDPPQGKILKDAAGEPTGILLDSALQLVNRVLPQPSKAAMKAALDAALAEARRYGVTSIQTTVGGTPGLLEMDARTELKAWRELDRAGRVTARVFFWGDLRKPQAMVRLRDDFSGLPAERFRLAGLKGFVDGVVSARTAYLAEPYADDPQARGKPVLGPEALDKLVLEGNRLGFQVELHAIGDAAVSMALDAFERSQEALGALRLPNKIEHVELVLPRDIPRFKALGVFASVQPSHCTYDLEEQNYNDARLGKERIGCCAFAWRSLQEAGAPLAFGTDWSVMPLNPMWGLFAAVTRRHTNDKPGDGWTPGQRISMADAVRHYTMGSAEAQGRGAELGSIAPGKFADFVVLAEDVFALADARLLKVPVDETWFDGRPVYRRRTHARLHDQGGSGPGFAAKSIQP